MMSRTLVGLRDAARLSLAEAKEACISRTGAWSSWLSPLSPEVPDKLSVAIP